MKQLRMFALLPEHKCQPLHIQINETTIQPLYGEVLRRRRRQEEEVVDPTRGMKKGFEKTQIMWESLFKIKSRYFRAGNRSSFNWSLRTNGKSASVLVLKQFVSTAAAAAGDRHVGWNAGGGLDELSVGGRSNDEGTRLDNELKRIQDQIQDSDQYQATEMNKSKAKQARQLRTLGNLRDSKRKIRLVGIDPGCKELYMAATMDGHHRDIYGCSNGEYRHRSGAIKHQKKVQKWQDHERKGEFKKIAITEMPSSKVADIQEYRRYISYLVRHLHTIMEFYCRGRYKRSKHEQYVSRVRTLDRVCQEITAYNSNTVVGFGAAKFDVCMVGNAPIPGGALRKRLVMHAKAVIDIDEHRTSKVCSKCLLRNYDIEVGSKDPKRYDLEAPKHRQLTIRVTTANGKEREIKCRKTKRHKENNEARHGKETKMDTGEDGVIDVIEEKTSEIHGVRLCNKCHTTWNRDVNAARNILHLLLWLNDAFQSGIDLINARPPHLSRINSESKTAS